VYAAKTRADQLEADVRVAKSARDKTEAQNQKLTEQIAKVR
jgi:hypothetical protein